jgi:hypothetical protein
MKEEHLTLVTHSVYSLLVAAAAFAVAEMMQLEQHSSILFVPMHFFAD